MTACGTAELLQRHPISSAMLVRLINFGVIQPAPGPRGSGSRLWFYESEQRAVAAVAALSSSPLWKGATSKKSVAARDAALRAVADAARAPMPATGRARWLILAADGSCVRGDDWLAGAMTEHRTLIELTA